jgi:hypothetical protein
MPVRRMFGPIETSEPRQFFGLNTVEFSAHSSTISPRDCRASINEPTHQWFHPNATNGGQWHQCDTKAMVAPRDGR